MVALMKKCTNTERIIETNDLNVFNGTNDIISNCCEATY